MNRASARCVFVALLQLTICIILPANSYHLSLFSSSRVTNSACLRRSQIIVSRWRVHNTVLYSNADNGDLADEPAAQAIDIEESDDTTISKTPMLDRLRAEMEAEKRQSRRTFVGAAVASSSWYGWQLLHPSTPTTLLSTLTRSSPPLATVGKGRPTIVEFWAPWCENCKATAGEVWRVREAYKNQVDFVFVQGDTPEAMDLVDFFHVDAIPHITFVSSSGVIKNNLIGKAPREIFEESIKSLLDETEPRFAMETGAEGKNVKTFVANNMKDIK
ncbi:hypothetical protein TrVE_jg11575 [Triparma verrucosa]|uniref:Thioredoxin domain-containing protein n=1 Tax=Triparma verrucosa TaxID=1606542 RepID=A0A9W7BIA4_9STRA|nr:hypothetical protein TrVE_jg11575 [Triparma verrucosa]